MDKTISTPRDNVSSGMAHMSDGEALAHLMRVGVLDDTQGEPMTDEQDAAWWGIEAPPVKTIEAED